MSSGEADAVRVAYGNYDLKPTPTLRVVAVAGIPGAGKTTLARALAEHYGWGYIGTGDTARAVDPKSLAQGGMADESLFREAFKMRLAKWTGPEMVVLDGIPRSRGQIELLPYFTTLLALTCRPDIARERLLRRGREDDTPDLVDRRITEQSDLLDVQHADGWLYTLAGWGRVINTSQKRPEEIAADVIAFLDGKKKQAF